MFGLLQIVDILFNFYRLRLTFLRKVQRFGTKMKDTKVLWEKRNDGHIQPLR